MKKITTKIPFFLFIAVFTFIKVQLSFAQCTIDSTQTIPGLYPDTVSDAVANHPYNQDITFVLVADTLGLTITNYHIVSINGLPFGMNWACNNTGNGCNYDPAVSLYGCVNISGTSFVAGSYIANVTIVATVTTLGDQTINYYMPLNVLPDTVSNAGFSMINATGCSPLTVGFTNNLPGQTSYLWDFGNSVTDTSENPGPQTYNAAGTYVVTQTVVPNVPPQYFLTAVTVDSIPDNYNELGFLDPQPDMFFVLSDTAGNTIYDSRPAVNNTQPPYTWTLPNIQLNNENYTIQVWDQDSLIVSLGDDDLGTISFAGWGTSGSATDTLAGISGLLNLSFIINQLPVLPVVSTDTVRVFATPPVPTITASGPLTFCAGDSVTLTSSSVFNNQWLESNIYLQGDTNQSLTLTIAGYYSVLVTSPEGCTSLSEDTAVQINPLPAKPTMYVTGGDTINCALTGYNLQWYLNGNLIPGATGQFYIPLVSGTYTVVATDPNGCSKSSDPLLFQGVGIQENNDVKFLEITPNPSQGLFMIGFESKQVEDFNVTITDIAGRIILQKDLKQVIGVYHTQINLGNQARGMYLLELRSKTFSAKRKISVSE